MPTTIKIKLNEKLYIRDPEETELGRKIIAKSIKMIDELGYENFTFKKLANEIESTEASVYRYFENKYKLLIYLMAWYWVWLDYLIKYETHNIKDPNEKIRIIIQVISKPQEDDPKTNIDEGALYRIVVAEASKSYLSKDIDSANQDGLFRDYKKLCANIAAIILQITPGYAYANALVSMLIEAAHHQAYFAEHLPSLTNISKGQNYSEVAQFLEHILFAAIGKPNQI